MSPRSAEGQRLSRAERYTEYKRHCRDEGVKPQWGRWSQHWAEIRTGSVREPRMTAEQHRAYWAERLTADEIREFGGGIDLLVGEKS